MRRLIKVPAKKEVEFSPYMDMYTNGECPDVSVTSALYFMAYVFYLTHR